MQQRCAGAPAIEGLQLRKEDSTSFVSSVDQSCQVELFCLPASDGTPEITLDFPRCPEGQQHGLVEESFVFVANQVNLDDSLEMPFVMVHVDRAQHWKRL